MALILRKCWKDGHSRNGFFYGNAGDVVTCPDWSPEPKCGHGLHGLLEGNGNWRLLLGDDWLVIEAKEEDIVIIDNNKCKFRTGEIVFRGTTTELRISEFASKFINLNSVSAYDWALHIGNRDIMMHKINNSYDAYFWARDFGNRDVMINKITNSWIAYLWARDFGNHDVMMPKINNSNSAYWWARTIGNQDIMKPKVTQFECVCYWNKSFPDNPIAT